MQVPVPLLPSALLGQACSLRRWRRFGVLLWCQERKKLSICRENTVRTNVQDDCILHADPGYPAVVGDDCIVGHRAVVHGCESTSSAPLPSGIGAARRLDSLMGRC